MIKSFYKELVSNLRVDLIHCAYTECWQVWADIDYTPDYNKFYFICGGEGWIKIGNEQYYPKQGQLVLMPAGILQSFSEINSNRYKKYWCHFTAKVGDLNLFDIVHPNYCINATDRNYVKALFEKLTDLYQKNDLSALICAKSVLLELIAHYIENIGINEANDNTGAWSKIIFVLEYIEGNLSQDIRIEQLARLLHLHPNYFIRFFKSHTGLSPIQYINKARLERAKSLLHSSNYNITEVAGQIGFKDIAHFSKMFKAYTGFSPSEFKRFNK